MATYKVTANSLRLRSTPNSETHRNIIAVLSNGQLVEKIADSVPDWWEVRILQSGAAAATGFVAHRFLQAVQSAAVPSPPLVSNAFLASLVKPVHMTENRTSVVRNVITGRAYPLGEPNRPFRDRSTVPAASASIHNIVNWINVEQSDRYAPNSTSTYCNIYAHDYCYLNGAYLPRVWWSSRALIDLSNRIQVPVQYGQTVNELNANSLLRWFLEWGDDFGWKRVFDLNELQTEANRGKVCIISARNANENRSGHICAVVPENNLQKATRNADGSVKIPLQSQAGRVNKKYFNNSLWWLTPTFADFGYFVHE
ncbi:hypothetical protein GCM10009119_13190 [Algoriphagus jejuensis]|uniref:SH3 domain-containing protein n=1 Tax=Algoriphagus jejuensis TaxID=419934 RepID=A0ABP3YA81_9BACT